MGNGEILDVLTSRGELLGAASRDVIHHYGLWHQTSIFMVYDEARDKVVCQVKSKDKYSDNAEDIEIDFSAGGHVTKGEDPLTSFRELNEELGLKPGDYIAHFIGKRQSAADIAEHYKEYEWQTLWFCVTSNYPMDKYIHNNESRALIEVKPDEVVALLNGSVEIIDATLYTSGAGFVEQKISKDNFVPAYVTGDEIFKRLFEIICMYKQQGTPDTLSEE